MEHTDSEAATIAELAREGVHPMILAAEDGREFLMIPEGMTRHEIPDEHGLKRSEPRYLSQAVTLQTVDSLVDYVNRFKGAETMLFANIDANAIVGAIDYHTSSAENAKPEPRRVAHRATMTLPHAEEWRVWTGIHGKLVGQLEFARFLEENGGDITAPSGADVLEACRDLQAHRKVNFTKAVRTATDNENFEYSDETEARTRGGIELPTKFQLKIPVYFGEPPTEVYAFLRWSLDEGALKLGIALHRAEHVRQAVFKQIVMAAGERTGCPVVFGKL